MVMVISSVIALPARGRIYRRPGRLKGENIGLYAERLWRNGNAEIGAEYDQCVTKRVKKELGETFWDRISNLWKPRSGPEPPPSIEQRQAILEVYKRHKEYCRKRILRSQYVTVSKKWEEGYVVREMLRRTLARTRSTKQPQAALERLRRLIPFLREEEKQYGGPQDGGPRDRGPQDGGQQDRGSENAITSLVEAPGQLATSVGQGVTRAFRVGSEGQGGQIPVNGAGPAPLHVGPPIGR